MNTWIPLNLPWSRVPAAVEAANERKHKKADKLYSKSQRFAETQVGQTIVAAIKQLNEVRLTNLRLKWHDATEKDLSNLWNADLDKVKKKYPILDQNLFCTPPDLCDEAWLKKVQKVAQRNPVALALAHFYHVKWKVITLADQQPEVAQARALEEEATAANQAGAFNSICGSHEMCRPGVLIEVQDHKTKKIRQMLIGHIGPEGGANPNEIDPDERDVVLRACVVWEPEK